LAERSSSGGGSFSSRRVLAALAIGLAGSVFIWVATPLNSIMLRNTGIADNYMPPAALFVVLVLVLALNPLLRRLAPRLALSGRQLALIFAVLLVACVIPGAGFIGFMPDSLTASCVEVTEDPALARGYEAVAPPPSLFPDRLARENVSASTPYRDKLPEGESIPWGSWLAPLLAWNGFLIPWMVMMIAMAVIVLPQWRDNERLAFPLLTIEQALIEPPQDGRALPPIFRKSAFWWAVIIVFGLRFLTGLNTYFPAQIPAIDLSLDMYKCFKDGQFVYLPWWLQMSRVNFIFIGIAFFMPGRIGFSIWFFQILVGVYVVLKNLYAPPFYYPMLWDHANGAFIAVPLFVLWLGRRHWAQVIRSMVTRAKSAEARRDRIAGYAFLLGCGGMGAWLLWVGVLPLWALGLVVLAVLYALAITRVVAETGIPLSSPEMVHTMNPVRMLPIAWRNAASMYFSGVIAVFNAFANRVCGMTMVLHGLAMDKRSSPRHQVRLGALFIVILVLGVIVAGAVHLWAKYTPGTELYVAEPSAPAEAGSPFAAGPEKMLGFWQKETGDGAQYSRLGHIGFGAALSVVLLCLCLLSPRWPLHPVALLLGGMGPTYLLWFNVFIGWLAKMLILRYGGSQLYSRARPFFIGLLMGEVFAIVFWGALGAVLGALGKSYQVILF